MNSRMILMRALLVTVTGLLPVNAAVTMFSGSIRQDTTWADTVRISGDVIVRDGAVLTIAPGTHVQFADTNRNVLFGTPDEIYLLALTTGGIQAEGTEWAPVVFKRDDAFSRDGDWGKIQLIANDGLSSFRHCRFEHAVTALCAYNPDGYTGITELNVHECVFIRCDQAVFVGSGASVALTDSRIDSCNYGIVCNSASFIDLRFLTLADNASGIIIWGESDIVTTGTIDHVTIYGTDPINAYDAIWWGKGFGILFCGTAHAGFELKNSIIAQSALVNLSSTWGLNEHHNCLFLGDGTINVEGDSIGLYSITDDPLFDDLENRLFSLDQMMSPCLYAADDGTHMGAWWNGGAAAVSRNDAVASGLPVRENPVDRRIRLHPDGTSAAFALFDMRGVCVLAGRTNGRGCIDVSGIRDGAYLLKTCNGGAYSYRRIIVGH